jgi:hypothetical protein
LIIPCSEEYKPVKIDMNDGAVKSDAENALLNLIPF